MTHLKKPPICHYKYQVKINKYVTNVMSMHWYDRNHMSYHKSSIVFLCGIVIVKM